MQFKDVLPQLPDTVYTFNSLFEMQLSPVPLKERIPSVFQFSI